jgi:hypothetical protein
MESLRPSAREGSVRCKRSKTRGSSSSGIPAPVSETSSALRAIELAPYDVCVNSVCPGYILTDLAAEGEMSEEEIGEYTSKIPPDGYGRAEGVVGAFLGSDEASLVTGTHVEVEAFMALVKMYALTMVEWYRVFR